MTLEDAYSSMARWAGKNLINGKATWSQVTTNKQTAKYADEALEYLNEQGYMIDEEGRCVKIEQDD